ncbi:MAG: hypothetical protein NVSMB32_10920 [Actinomycetota bacterium]
MDDQRVRLPRVVAFLALGGIVAGLLLSALGGTVAGLLAPHSRLLLVGLSQTGLWTGLVGAVIVSSRRYGSGNIWRDFAVHARSGDVGRGLLISIAARFAGFVLLVPLISINRKFSGSDLRSLQIARHDPALLLILIALALVGAPLVEELFFRGLLLRSLLPLAGTAAAIAGQALIFAFLHLRPSYGLGNVSLFVAIGAMGAVQGHVAERYRRLGPGIYAHAVFNLVAVLVVLLTR